MQKLAIPDNLTLRAYRSIKDYILEGPSEDTLRLTEEYLSEKLGISKSPVREALNRIESEGLIRIEPRRGAFLQTFSSKEVSDLYDLREALEVHVVRTAKVSAPLLKELRANVRRMRASRKANDRTNFIKDDISYHEALAQATGNECLVKTLGNIQNQIYLSRRKTYELSASSATDYHDAVLDALEKDDRPEAERLMREHIGTARKALTRFLDEIEQARGVRNPAAR